MARGCQYFLMLSRPCTSVIAEWNNVDKARCDKNKQYEVGKDKGERPRVGEEGSHCLNRSIS